MTPKEALLKAKQSSDEFIKEMDKQLKDNPAYPIVRRSITQAFMTGFIRGVLFAKTLKPVPTTPINR